MKPSSAFIEKKATNMKKKSRLNTLKKVMVRDYELYLLSLPAIIFFIVFHYMPMYGIQIAFKDFSARLGIWDSPFAGLYHFRRFFNSFQCWLTIRNTIIINIYQLVAGFPLPIILALMLNQIKNKHFKKTLQTITYFPHFISTVVLCGMMYIFLSPRNGIVNSFIEIFGGEKIFFLGEASWFRDIFVWSGVWQNMGWGSIIYLAALSAVNTNLYEAARIDGASRLRLILHIDIPAIVPLITIKLIMQMGHMMNVGFQKAYLLQNTMNSETSEIIATYVYKTGLLGAQYSYSTAIGLFNTVINVFLLIAANKLARTLTETSLW